MPELPEVEVTRRSFAERIAGAFRDLHPPTAWLRWIAAGTRRVAVFAVGVALLGAGAVMVVLPGPGVLVAVVGLAVLATEFAWAERMLDRTKARDAAATGAVRASRKAKASAVVSALRRVSAAGVPAESW